MTTVKALVLEKKGEISIKADVANLKPGDRVCMEPGIPDPMSKASISGMYNLDPSVVFLAPPPVHGVTRPSVVHPAKKAAISPGDTAVVTGAGTIGMPVEPVELDIVKAQAKEIRIETIFRYTNAYRRSIALIESGKVDLKPLITDTFDFNEGIEAYNFAANPPPSSVKIQIQIAK